MHTWIVHSNLHNRKTTHHNLSKMINTQQGTEQGLRIALCNKRERGNLRFFMLCCIRIFIAGDGCTSGESLSMVWMSPSEMNSSFH